MLIRYVARKELREIVRDGRLRLLGAIVAILAIAALAFGAEQTHRSQEAREHASEHADAQWEGQGEKNPHVAAHYGTHVFAPTSAATAIDPGVSNYLGRSVKIEAHKRNLAAHSSAQDSAGSQRLGSFSVSTVLLQLLPLLIIALGYGLWSRERERGTLRQLLSTGVDRRTLLWGKALALFGIVAALLIPAAAIIVGVLWSLGGGDASTLIRLGFLGLGYGIYFAMFGGLTLYASAAAHSSRLALVGMIGIWGLFCLIVPRGATEIAETFRPLPSQAELARDVTHSLENGIDGNTPREDGVDAIVTEMMAEEGFSNAGAMLLEADEIGMELQAEARWEDSVFDHHIRQLDDRLAAQEEMVAWAGFLSPFVAMRTLSSGLCGTDFAHHRHFTEYAEQWRKALITQLNQSFAENEGGMGWDYQAGPELWKEAPPFEYAAPDASFALRYHLISILALLFWLVLAVGLALWSARKVKVV